MKKITILLLLSTIFVAASLAQDTKQTFTRKVLIEQFTGAACQWCPSGAERIASAISSSSSVVWIKHHAGFGTDFLTNDIATSMTIFYGGGLFAPAVMFDRTHFNSSQPAPVMSVGQVSDIRGYIAQAKGVATTCKVYTPDVAYDPATRHLSGTVTGRFGDNSYGDSTRLVLYVVEDSIVGPQTDHDRGRINNFVHMGTVRAAITDMWGDPLVVDPANENSFSYTVDYTLPDDFVYRNCLLVAFVYNYDPSDVNNCSVLNAAQGKYLDSHLGVGEVAESTAMRIFPNPAHHVASVELSSPSSACRVDLLDAAGRCLLTRTAQGAATLQLDTHQLPAGLYLVRLTTPDGVATRQLLIR